MIGTEKKSVHIQNHKMSIWVENDRSVQGKETHLDHKKNFPN
jgi:hypothetical protein